MKWVFSNQVFSLHFSKCMMTLLFTLTRIKIGPRYTAYICVWFGGSNNFIFNPFLRCFILQETWYSGRFFFSTPGSYGIKNNDVRNDKSCRRNDQCLISRYASNPVTCESAFFKMIPHNMHIMGDYVEFSHGKILRILPLVQEILLIWGLSEDKGHITVNPRLTVPGYISFP